MSLVIVTSEKDGVRITAPRPPSVRYSKGSRGLRHRGLRSPPPGEVATPPLCQCQRLQTQRRVSMVAGLRRLLPAATVTATLPGQEVAASVRGGALAVTTPMAKTGEATTGVSALAPAVVSPTTRSPEQASSSSSRRRPRRGGWKSRSRQPEKRFHLGLDKAP